MELKKVNSQVWCRSRGECEYFQWRETLREQIEKELDYQVGVRLAGSDRLVRPLSSEHQIVREILPLSTRCTHQRQSDRVSKLYSSCGLLESASISRWSGPNYEQPVSAHIYTSSTAGMKQRKESIPVLFSYVSSKYGTPADQLKHLSCCGSFKSADIESSGHGSGPILHFPPEANITLPTPTHSMNISPCVLSLRGSTESNHIFTTVTPAAGPCSFIGSGHSSGDTSTKLHVGSRTGATPISRLKFESCFEGGNLQQAIAIGPQEYKLLLRPDLYSKRHMQWFYFRVQGMQASIPYQFHIINLLKPDSLYNHGMQPLLYSEKGAERGWTRVGYNVTYSKNCNQSSVASNDGEFFTLSWTMEFPHSEDQCYLAHCFPYPFSKLIQYINHLQLSPTASLCLQCQQLCKTLAGNTCPVLTITDFQDDSNMDHRSGVVVTARVHPGESNSSWMMQGLIDWLTSDTPHAKVLRRHFVFKLIPMLNPDGVIVGNSRTSLAGVDLNRIYRKPRKDLFPTIFHTKALLSSFMQEREVVLYMDLHGHSRKQNVFTYGCRSNQGDHNQFLNERIFPFLMSRQLPNEFCFSSCKYSVQRCKESTGRVVAWRMGLNNAFTLESTFCGSTLGQSTSRQFCERDLEDVGRGLGEAIYRYHRMLTTKSYKQKVLSELAEVMLKKQNCSARETALPDLLQFTVHQHRTTACSEQREANEKIKAAATKRMKVLQEFMKCDLSLLEIESSTTGSNSENDEFEYLETKKERKQHRKKRRHHAQRSTTLPSLPELAKQPSSTTKSIQTAERSSHHPRPTAASISELMRKKTVGKRVSRDQQTSSKQPQGWRFVNRYAHRSNGGIPIFSEERLQERARKHQLLTSSWLPKDQTQARLLWQPEDSSVLTGMIADEKPSGVAGQSYTSSSKGSGAQITKSKIEKALQEAITTITPGLGTSTVRDPADTISARRRDKIRGAMHKLGAAQRLDQTSKHEEACLGYSFTKKPTLKLPTHMVKYISEIWKNSIQ